MIGVRFLAQTGVKWTWTRFLDCRRASSEGLNQVGGKMTTRGASSQCRGASGDAIFGSLKQRSLRSCETNVVATRGSPFGMLAERVDIVAPRVAHRWNA